MIPNNAKIYIAGHRGLVGSSINNKFESQGYTNLLVKTHAELDLLSQSAVETFFQQERPEYVILAAARVGGIKENMLHQAEFLYQNTQIQNNVIWAAHQSGVKKFLFLGSSCIYPRSSPQPMKEQYLLDGKLEPTNEGYALAKINGMKLCDKIYEQFDKAFISCMPTNIYGIGDHFNAESSHVIPSLIYKMHKAKTEQIPEVEIWGSGSSRREFLFVEDLADAVFWLMNHYEEKQFLNVGTGEDISIKELAYLIQEIIGYSGKLAFNTSKPDGMPKKLLDVSRINKLGWKHTTSLREGIMKTYDWYKNSSKAHNG